MTLPTHPTQTPSDDTCLNVIDDTVSARPGIVKVDLDPQRELVSFEYDPQRISEPELRSLAQQMTPTFRRRFETCTMRLGAQGGRSCESCALLLENRVRQVAGVRRAAASYRSGVLSVTYDNAVLSPDQIRQQVKQLGVKIAPPASEPPSLETEAAPTPLGGRLRAWATADRLEAIFTAITFVAMISALIAEQLGASPLVLTSLYAVAYVFGGVFGVKGGIESLRHRAIDVDLLMMLAAAGAWFVGSPFEGAMLLFLFSLSNVLQAFALDRTRNAIRALMKLRPKQALVRRGGRTLMLPIEKVLLNDIVIVRPGERLPMDGVVVEGESSVDQSSITGESMPVSKHAGSSVLAGTINIAGGLEVRVTRLAQDSAIAKMIKLVEEAHSEKAKTQRFIDRFEQYYALGVIGLTLALIIVPIYLLGEAVEPAFYRAMTAMVAASPCALVISTPASILSAIGNGARRGVLFKGGVHLEQAAGIKVVAFDKTGTLTQGKPQVTDVVNSEQWSATSGPDNRSLITDHLLTLAAAVEAKSEHPLAQAIVKAARERNIPLPEAGAFQADMGKGVRAVVHGQDIAMGNLRYFESYTLTNGEAALQHVQRLQDEGRTSVIVARLAEPRTAHILGVIAIADVLRPEAAETVRELNDAGVRVVMLTGDNARVAKAIAAQAGMDDFYADLLPEDKLRLIKELRETYGPVAMVGDGVNDAPALATAHLGIAMGAAGTDVALETADVVLMADDLRNIPYVMSLSRATRKTLLVNLGFALFMIGLMLISIFAVQLPLPLAVVGHEGGTVLVSLNGLRLLAYRRPRMGNRFA